MRGRLILYYIGREAFLTSVSHTFIILQRLYKRSVDWLMGIIKKWRSGRDHNDIDEAQDISQAEKEEESAVQLMRPVMIRKMRVPIRRMMLLQRNVQEGGAGAGIMQRRERRGREKKNLLGKSRLSSRAVLSAVLLWFIWE